MDPPAPFSAGDWARYLQAELNCPVEVSFGRARHRVLVARPVVLAGGSGYRLRLNALFAEAPPEVRQAVAAWLRSGRRARRACARLDTWIEELGRRLAASPPARRPRIEPRGECHDLEALAAELRVTHFPPELLPAERWPAITWGHRARRRVRHSLRLGSYDPEAGLVRVHPVLDSPRVPRWYVRYVLFHELLHAALPPRPGAGGRTVHHGPEFRRRERAYPDFERAATWLKGHFGQLRAAVARGSF